MWREWTHVCEQKGDCLMRWATWQVLQPCMYSALFWLHSGFGSSIPSLSSILTLVHWNTSDSVAGSSEGRKTLSTAGVVGAAVICAVFTLTRAPVLLTGATLPAVCSRWLGVVTCVRFPVSIRLCQEGVVCGIGPTAELLQVAPGPLTARSHMFCC